MSIIKLVYDLCMLVGAYYGYLAAYKPDSIRFKYYGKKLSSYPTEIKMKCDRYVGLRLLVICIFNIVALHTFKYLPTKYDKYGDALIWFVFMGFSLNSIIGPHGIMKKYDERQKANEKIDLE